MDELARFLDLALPVLRVALALAIAVVVVAGLSKVMGPVTTWAERRVLPWLSRRSRARAGLAPDAPRWACRACRSVNEATAESCYRCGAPATVAADPLPEPDGELYRPRAAVDRFDPSLYRGPGATAFVPPAAPRPPSEGVVDGSSGTAPETPPHGSGPAPGRTLPS